MTSRIYRFLTVIAALAILFSIRVQPLRANVTSVTLSNPGAHAEAPDYFTDVWGNPKDMNDPYDMYVLSSTCNPTQPAEWSNTSYTSGIWRGTTASTAAPFRYLWLLNPGWSSSLDIGEDGQVAKINTTYYTQLSFRMRIQSGAGTADGNVAWYDGPIGTGLRGAALFSLKTDGEWHIYTFDLDNVYSWETQGPVSSLWLQLEQLPAGYLVEIDWVRLTPKQNYTVNWTTSSPSGTTVRLFAGANLSDANQRSRIEFYPAVNIPPSAGTAVIPTSFPAGTYYVRVADDGGSATSSQSWQVVGAPVAQIVAPGYSSGADWATTVAGNSWDMNGTDDIDGAETQSLNYAASGGVLDVTNIPDGQSNPCGTPWPHRPLALNTHGQTIDTAKFKYLTFRYKVDQAPDQGAGGVIRARWLNTSIWAAGRTDDISLYNNGWNTYQLDLSTVALEAETAGWTEWNYNWLHLMANESHFAWTSHLDWVKLTADNEATGSYLVGWNLIQGDPTTTTIYWDADQNPSAGLIGGYVVAPSGPVDPPPYPNNVYLPMALNSYNGSSGTVDATFSYPVSTTGLTDGQWYYIALKLQDGYNTRWWYSELPVKILQ